MPYVLRGSKSKGGKETAEVIGFYKDKKNKDKSYPFEAYKSAEIKTALYELFHEKCAYCESKIRHIQPMDVEHFRPKQLISIKGRYIRPGYYWLATNWENLFPSCINCNRDSRQILNETDAEKVVGKKNYFPIIDERKRAKAPGEEVNEDPMLLNPCKDKPEEHLKFLESGIVRPRMDDYGKESNKGRVSIDIYGLDRKPLVVERRRIAGEINRAISRTISSIRRYNKFKNSPHISKCEIDEFELEMKSELKLLYKFTQEDKPYSGMARQLINPFISKLK